MSGGIGLTTAYKPRNQIQAEAIGYKGENYPLMNATSSALMADGVFYSFILGFRAGDVISNVHIILSVDGVSLTLSKVGVYSLDGQTRHAVSSELGTAWSSNAPGQVSNALTTPYVVPTDIGLRLGIVCKGGTLPTLARSFAATTTAPITDWSNIPETMLSGQTDLPTTFTPAVSTGGPGFWVGWS